MNSNGNFLPLTVEVDRDYLQSLTLIELKEWMEEIGSLGISLSSQDIDFFETLLLKKKIAKMKNLWAKKEEDPELILANLLSDWEKCHCPQLGRVTWDKKFNGTHIIILLNPQQGGNRDLKERGIDIKIYNGEQYFPQLSRIFSFRKSLSDKSFLQRKKTFPH
ncbi:MAG TPA: hypothetical protein PKD96_04725, partial [Candidatus Absconditabacterales bacterium]|nr:hypothetical protein [Candidatus Absconditabacterales bacterium]